jgi:two-component system OmpR family sensor kinase/two-component system sensor histidine kinase BaeS
MRLRLIASFLLVVLVTIGVVIVVALRQTASEVRTFLFRGGLTNSAEIVAALEAYYAEHQTWEGAENLLAEFFAVGTRQGQGQGRGAGQAQRQPNLPHLRLLDSQGNILFDTRADAIPEQLSAADIENAIPLRDQADRLIGYLLPEGNQVFTAAEEAALLDRLNKAAIVAVILAGSAAALLALVLAYRLLRPVRALTRAAAQMAAGDLSQRVAVRGDDELARLGKAFNHMAASLQQAEESRRALTADIAHELRTPLAVQRAHLDALQDGIYDLTPENLTPIEEQNRLLARLVDDLRTLALADSGQLELSRTPTDFVALIRRTLTQLEPQAASSQIEIQPFLAESCPLLLLDAQRVEQILNNLLTNALRHTPAGGCITLQLTPTPRNLRLSIRDSGPGIPVEALPHLFDRFFRADSSRNRAQGGTGLGLSIARQLARAHGGDLTAANHPEGGAVFTLTLPLTP